MFLKSDFMLRQARWVVVGLLFCMGLAIASPLVKPKSMAVVCTGANALVLVAIDAGTDPAELLVTTLDCADCLPAVLPPQDLAVCSFHKPDQAQPATASASRVPAAHCLSPPPRGPPNSVFPT